MGHYFRRFKEATLQTKYFILTVVLFGLIVAITTIYSYVRLVPSIKKTVTEEILP